MAHFKGVIYGIVYLSPFETIQNIIFDTNTSNGYVLRTFNTNQLISTSTISGEMHAINQFASSNQNIVINTNESDLDIIGTSNTPIAPRKIQYMIDSLISDSIESEYPLFKEFIYSYLKYLDLTSIKSTINILNNNNITTVYKEFIDSYLDNFFKDIINLNKYGLTDDNKRRFLQQSRLLLNLKGNRKVFDFLFRSLTDIQIAQDDIKIEVDKIAIDYLENEDWWFPNNLNYYDSTILYNGVHNHSVSLSKPFTYQFKIDQSLDTIRPLIDSVHPSGFDYEFLTEASFSDDGQMNDEIGMTSKYYHFYAYNEPNMTNYTYDGSIMYSEYHEVDLIF